MCKEEIFIVAILKSGGKVLGRDRIMSRKWFVSWTCEGRDLTVGSRWASIVGRDKFSLRNIGGDDGMARVTSFMYLGKY